MLVRNKPLFLRYFYKYFNYFILVYLPTKYYYFFRPIDGVSTYNVIPFEAGPYFNKIQCFCFEEQRLNPGEEVNYLSAF